MPNSLGTSFYSFNSVSDEKLFKEIDTKSLNNTFLSVK
uniref:Uncharacterized protein n=1 Tax=Bostrychia tenella TaxID=324755 RepID=A0A1Z1M5Z4_9FLOR|nr:hypothetical protein [Bostrychia tenella]ARW61263.1 hypothetical protein [Bostrychia tenella]